VNLYYLSDQPHSIISQLKLFHLSKVLYTTSHTHI